MKKICMGVILGAHGIRGEVKIKYFSETADALLRYPMADASGTRSFVFKKIREAHGHAIASLTNISDRTTAETLRGTQIFTDRANLPPAGPNEFYIEDLRGLRAQSPDGKPLGTVTAVHNFGAGTILEIAHSTETTELYPFNNDCFPEIHIEQNYLIFVPPETVIEHEDK